MTRYEFIYKHILNDIEEFKSTIVNSPKGETLAIVEFNNALREASRSERLISIISIREI